MLKLALALCLMPAAAAPQVAGHGSVPSSGPAAQQRERPTREQDPVLAQLERIRADLATVAKRYRKARETERRELARRLGPALDEIAASVARLEPAAQQRVR